MIFYTVPEVALMLRVSKSYVYDIILRGQLKTVRLSERRTRISEEALTQFTTVATSNVRYNDVVQPPRPRRGRIKNAYIN